MATQKYIDDELMRDKMWRATSQDDVVKFKLKKYARSSTWWGWESRRHIDEEQARDLWKEKFSGRLLKTAEIQDIYLAGLHSSFLVLCVLVRLLGLLSVVWSGATTGIQFVAF